MQIRALRPEDREVYLTMTGEFYASGASVCTVPPEYRIACFEEMLRSDMYVGGFILECDSVPVGFALISKTYSQEAGGLVVWLEELYVRDGYRGKGYASRVLSYIEEKIPAARYRLETESGNFGAKRLYERHGYAPFPYEQYKKGK